MNIARVFQLDIARQLLIRLVDMPVYGPDVCLMFSTGINGCIVEIPVVYINEDIRNQMFDEADEAFAMHMYGELYDEYLRMTDRGYLN